MYDGAIMPLEVVSPYPAPLAFVRAGAVALLAICLAACGSSGGKGVAQRGSYVIMRAANPGSGYAVECLFQGNRTIRLVQCKEA